MAIAEKNLHPELPDTSACRSQRAIIPLMASSLREFPPQFWCVAGATFLGFLGIGTVLPGLAPHVRHDLGGSDETVGFVIGIFSFVALAARFFSGPLADTRGRKTAFSTGLLCCAVAGAVYLAPLGIAGVYLARVLQGFGEAFLYTGAATWAVEIAGVHRSAQALGYVSSGIWGGMSAGPVLGHWVGSFQHAAVDTDVLALLGFALLVRVPERFKPHPHRAKRNWLPRSIITARLRRWIRQRALPRHHRLSDSAPRPTRQFRTGGIHCLRRGHSVLPFLSGQLAGQGASEDYLLHGPGCDDRWDC